MVHVKIMNMYIKVTFFPQKNHKTVQNTPIKYFPFSIYLILLTRLKKSVYDVDLGNPAICYIPIISPVLRT